MHEYARRHAVAVNAGELAAAAFGIKDEPGNQEHIQPDYHKASKEAPFLANGAEDKVRGLLRHKAEGSLRALQETLSKKAAGAYGNL